MCGIAGIAGKKNQNESRNQVAVMLDELKHRGPNDEGIEVFENAVFGHRRLSIFDLSAAGHQPMLSSAENISIIFNGAIYNFLNLRRELEAEGFSFRSQTDTEVLINGYAAWGIDKLVGKIEGMFAFGLWDKRRKTLYLVRDRLGVKPLVYSVKNGELAFASTVRALKPFACASGLGLLKISREVSKSATVLLTGDGGDDVFLGYPEHLHFYLAEKVADKSPAILLSALQKTVSFFPQNVSVFKRANSFLQYAAGGLGAITRVRDGLPIYRENNLLGEK